MILYRPMKGKRNIDRRLTQSYGNNFKVNWKWMYWEIVKWRNKHEGLDYASETPWKKIPCYSSVDWTVTKTWFSSWWGNYVYIEFDWYELIYAHLDKITCKEWTIKYFDEVWIIWNTWNSTWVHLHYWLRKVWWVRIDPTQYITERDKNITTETSHFEDINNETQILIEDGLWNGELWTLDKRMLIILARVYKWLKS